MQWVRGNRAIRGHARDGKDLLLFEMAAKGHVRFLGEFACAGYEVTQAPDTDAQIREAFIFDLVPIDDLDKSSRNLSGLQHQTCQISIDGRLKLRPARSRQTPSPRSAMSTNGALQSGNTFWRALPVDVKAAAAMRRLSQKPGNPI